MEHPDFIHEEEFDTQNISKYDVLYGRSNSNTVDGYLPFHTIESAVMGKLGIIVKGKSDNGINIKTTIFKRHFPLLEQKGWFPNFKFDLSK